MENGDLSVLHGSTYLKVLHAWLAPTQPTHHRKKRDTYTHKSCPIHSPPLPHPPYSCISRQRTHHAYMSARQSPPTFLLHTPTWDGWEVGVSTHNKLGTYLLTYALSIVRRTSEVGGWLEKKRDPTPTHT